MERKFKKKKYDFSKFFILQTNTVDHANIKRRISYSFKDDVKRAA